MRGSGTRARAAAGAPAIPVRFVIVTLDAHLAGAFEAARVQLRRELPALELSLHVQAEWDADPGAIERARADIARANVIACAQLFTESRRRRSSMPSRRVATRPTRCSARSAPAS
jgi:magnesium chelatase subunit H